MPALVLALVVLLALLLPAAPFAINHGARQLHARRHAACLRNIAELEIAVGFADPPTTLDHKIHEFMRVAYEDHTSARDREKAWEKNKARLAKAPVQRHRRRGY